MGFSRSTEAALVLDGSFDDDLAARVVMAEARVKRLHEQLERTRTELRVAQLWVKELALWLDESCAEEDGHLSTA